MWWNYVLIAAWWVRRVSNSRQSQRDREEPNKLRLWEPHYIQFLLPHKRLLQTKWLKTIQIYYLPVPIAQESEQGSAGFSAQGFTRCQLQCGAHFEFRLSQAYCGLLSEFCSCGPRNDVPVFSLAVGQQPLSAPGGCSQFCHVDHIVISQHGCLLSARPAVSLTSPSFKGSSDLVKVSQCNWLWWIQNVLARNLIIEVVSCAKKGIIEGWGSLGIILEFYLP